MGLVHQLMSYPLVQQLQAQSPASQIAIVFGGAVLLSVVFNVVNQVLFKNPNEPPVVFHWFPFIGSTVTYGIDPPKFFKENRAKVWLFCLCRLDPRLRGKGSAQESERERARGALALAWWNATATS